MKKTTILILFSIWTSVTFCQDSYPLVEENRTWNVISVILVGPYPWDTSYYTTSYRFIGDTTIESKTYLKLYQSNEENPTNWSLWSYMREDDEKKVWHRRDSDENEILMYDFSLEVGDSILDYTGSTYLIIDSTGYETIGQDERKKYYLSSTEMPDYYSETWIDGIGSNKGICWAGSVLLVGGWSWFLCMSENGELVYMNPNYESCYLITKLDEIENPTIQVYPNPAKNLLRIDNLKKVELESISIININGQVIKQFDSRKTQLDISEISSGLYFLKVSYKNGELIEKIMIEKIMIE